MMALVPRMHPDTDVLNRANIDLTYALRRCVSPAFRRVSVQRVADALGTLKVTLHVTAQGDLERELISNILADFDAQQENYIIEWEVIEGVAALPSVPFEVRVVFERYEGWLGEVEADES